MAGYSSSNLIRTEQKMKKLYICGDLENAARIGNGLMAPRVQICAGHQANMVLRLLLGIEEV
jgi:sulfur carrier protein ThiS adenylyltransferase